jgi:ABC-2 type transport system ATP-binding protein
VKELIRSLAAQGRTIFFCSHVLEVVERVCGRIVIINGGQVVANGTPEAIARQTGTASLEAAFIALTGQRDAADVTQDLLRALGEPRPR